MTLTLPHDLLEAPFLSTVVDAARMHGWHASHQRPAQVRNGRWATAVTGNVGAPDLLLARGGVVLCAELKTNKGKLGNGQPEWAAAIGDNHYRLWRPRDWDTILRELR